MPHAHKSNRTRQEYGSARWRSYPVVGRETKTLTHRFERRNIQDIHLGIEEVLAERHEYIGDEDDLNSFWECLEDTEPEGIDPFDPFDDDWLDDYYFDEMDSWLCEDDHYFGTADYWLRENEYHYASRYAPVDRTQPEYLWMVYEEAKADEQYFAMLYDTYEFDPPPVILDTWQAREDIDDAIVDAFKARLQRKYPRCKHLTR